MEWSTAADQDHRKICELHTDPHIHNKQEYLTLKKYIVSELCKITVSPQSLRGESEVPFP
jgi:hypothetical protein